MSQIQRRASARKRTHAPDLSCHDVELHHHHCRAARRIAERFGLTIHHAGTIARNAGLGSEGTR